MLSEKQMGLVGALRRTIMEGVSVTDFTKEYKQLTEKDKSDLVNIFNGEKTFGDEVVVVMRTTTA